MTTSQITNENRLKKIFNDFNFIKGNFLILLCGWIIIDCTREMASTYYPLYVRDLGGNATILGIISSVALITEAFVKIPGGYLADNYRRKKLIIVMTLLAAISYLLFAFAPSWHFILLGTFLTSICWIYTPGFDSIVIETLPEEKRGTGYSIINLITQVSSTPSPLIAGYFLTRYGILKTSRIGFLLVSIAFLVTSIMRMRIKEENEKPEIKLMDFFRSFSNTKNFVHGLQVWNEVPRVLSVLLVVEILFFIPNAMFGTVMTFFFITDLGITGPQYSQLLTFIGTTMIIFAIPMGKIIDKFGRIKPLLLGYVLTFIGIPFIFDASFTRLLLIAPVIGMINILFHTSTQALWADIIPEDKRGSVMGSKGFFNLISIALGSILGGILYDNFSHNLPILIFWIVNIPCFLITILFIKEPTRSSK